jgi:hypothetical protein
VEDIENIKRHISPGIEPNSTKQIKQGVEKFSLRSINLLIPFGMRRKCLRSGMSRSL